PIFESEPVTFTADIELIAELAVSPDNGCGALPVAFLVVVLPAIFDQLGPEPLELAGVIVEFLAHGGRIKRYNHRAFTPPQSLGRPEGPKPIAFFTRSLQLAVLCDIQRHKVLGIDPGQFLGKVGGICGNEMNLVPAVDKLKVILGVHALVEDNREFPFALGKAHDHAKQLIEDLAEEP